ncbi:hypothetical protein ILUMI_14797 [Ignelater luminosus]|uniref:Transposase n=1 Tax=Ignelater luminosus TaxID=2038154 RepID=A0A8K0GA53_IGNLU|nr:hypothetical protein ILUMI_14797 [Ignelater luminosus]
MSNPIHNKDQKRASAARFERESHPKGVMVSLGISFKGITKPIFVNAGAKINSKYYQQNILTHYEKELGRLYPNNDSVFHQDSAPSHASKSTIKWLKDRNIKFIPPEEWMPSAPDCAPCDYFLWSYLKTCVDGHNHKTIAGLKNL